MNTTNNYRRIIEEVLIPYTKRKYAHGDFYNFPVFDPEQGQYLIMSQGWDDGRRIHGCLIHLELIDGKVWIQRDGTEHGIATDLEEAGIPKDHIVLGFHPPEVRPYTDYAAA